MSPHPLIFISAVTKELKSARQLVANTLNFLGYEPVWQEIFGTESGDLRGVLREKIGQCKGVVQLVGQCYGTEPPTPDEKYGRVSYTQYEGLYAREHGKKVWHLFLGENFPADPCDPEPEELCQLQATYRRRLQSDTHVFHQLTSSEALEGSVLKLRDDLTRLRRSVKQWAIGVVALLLFLSAVTVWLVQVQRRQTGVIQKQGEQVTAMQQALVRLADVEARSKPPGAKQSPDEQRAAAYHVLEKELGLSAGSLAKELPAFALELYNRADTTALMRARAAYALGKFDEAENLSLDAAGQDQRAYETAQRVQEDRRKLAIQGYVLAGQSAQKLIQYDKAMKHFREAEKLTDRERNPEDWAAVQYSIGDLLLDQGQYSSAENVLRSVMEVRNRVFGSDHPDTLTSRNRFAGALLLEGKHGEADAQYREIIKLQEKALGPEQPDTLKTRSNLAIVLANQGKYAEAEARYREVIKLQENVLGPEHPRTLGTRSSLAATLEAQGKYAEAEAQYREIIKLQEKVLGPEHPDTLTSRRLFAGVLLLEGKHAEAEAQCREVIKLQEKVLGPEHPRTLGTRSSLAATLEAQGKHAEAEAQYREIIKLQEKVLGPEHPGTLNSRIGLARTQMDQGKDAAAEMREVIKLQETIVGPIHPDTLQFCYDFAVGLERQGKTLEAKEFARRAAEGARKTLGPEHPSTRKYEKLFADLEAKH